MILGIDPGSQRCGFAILQPDPRGVRSVAAGTWVLSRGTALGEALREIAALCAVWAPPVLALERAFVAKNPHTALCLGQVRGVVLAIAQQRGMEIYEYSPRTIKKSVVGYGAAEKAQVQHMMQQLLALSGLPDPDTADAMAVAYCHWLQPPADRPGRVGGRRTRTRWTEHDYRSLRHPT